MGNLIHGPVAPVVQQNLTVQTVQGEVTVNLNLAIALKVEHDGTISLRAESISPSGQQRKESFESPGHVKLELPDLDEPEMMEFGKDV